MALFPLVLDASVKMAIVGIAVLFATRRAGPRHAAWAHRAWALVLAGFLVVPLSVAFAAPATAIVPSSPRLAGWLLTAQAGGLLGSAVLVVYLAGASVVAARIAGGLLAIRRLSARAIVLASHADDAARPLALACAARHAVLLETAALSAPATVGFFRPRIFLPPGWRDEDAAAMRSVVAHELAHVRRADHAFTVAAAVVCALWWFHPVAWLAAARLRWFAELACDAEAAEAAGSTAYARALLEIASRVDGRAPALVLGAGSAVARRVEALIDDRSAVPRRPVLAALAVAIFCLIGLLRFGETAAASTAVDDPHAARHAVRHGAHNH
jgi:beta-lactamase regulating signal transducer with metallopeptidase domain